MRPGVSTPAGEPHEYPPVSMSWSVAPAASSMTLSSGHRDRYDRWQQQFEIAKSAVTQAVAAAESVRDGRLQRDLDLFAHVPIVEMAERVQARQPDAGGAVTPCGHG